jgi:hypothetical protein
VVVAAELHGPIAAFGGGVQQVPYVLPSAKAPPSMPAKRTEPVPVVVKPMAALGQARRGRAVSCRLGSNRPRIAVTPG